MLPGSRFHPFRGAAPGGIAATGTGATLSGGDRCHPFRQSRSSRTTSSTSFPTLTPRPRSGPCPSHGCPAQIRREVTSGSTAVLPPTAQTGHTSASRSSPNAKLHAIIKLFGLPPPYPPTNFKAGGKLPTGKTAVRSPALSFSAATRKAPKNQP